MTCSVVCAFHQRSDHIDFTIEGVSAEQLCSLQKTTPDEATLQGWLFTNLSSKGNSQTTYANTWNRYHFKKRSFDTVSNPASPRENHQITHPKPSAASGADHSEFDLSFVTCNLSHQNMFSALRIYGKSCREQPVAMDSQIAEGANCKLVPICVYVLLFLLLGRFSDPLINSHGNYHQHPLVRHM